MSTTAPLSSEIAGRDLPPNAWKEELQERLREHRQRRAGGTSLGDASQWKENSREADAHGASRVAARVAERWKDAPSYQELLAATAAAAESAAHAALAAQAAAEAAMASWGPPPNPREDAQGASSSDPFADSFFSDDRRPGVPAETAREPESFFFSGPAIVEHHTPLPERTPLPPRAAAPSRARALVDAFAEAVVPAAQSLPAKLIEFPRELIAPRKQRPRLAEGPLLDEQSGMSLRIFEVATEPPPGVADGSSRIADGAPGHPVTHDLSMEDGSQSRSEREPSRRRGGFSGEASALRRAEPATGWSAIHLGEHPQAEPLEAPAAPARRPDQGYKVEAAPALKGLAPVSDRLMAALVDGALVFACFLLAAFVFASCIAHPPAVKTAAAAGFLTLGALGAFYGWLFMTYGGGSTPGMRYARIALCTFRDENPTRKQFRNRVPATALALLPLGVGVLWALLDEDKLGWHDRMTRTYQRSYR